jgi:hypothetical protein
MIAKTPNLPYTFSIFILAFIVGIVCGEDYRDKVANYELLSGHSRKSIFFARSLMGIIVGAFFTTILCLVPIIAGNVIAGWGSCLDRGDVIARYLLFFFPFLRLGAFFAVLTFLVKNPYVIMAAGFIIGEVNLMIGDMVTHSSSLYISLFNIKLLTEFDDWAIYNIDPVKGIVEYTAYNSSLTSGLVVGTIVVSLLMTGFYLFMGYSLFRRDEMN